MLVLAMEFSRGSPCAGAPPIGWVGTGTASGRRQSRSARRRHRRSGLEPEGSPPLPQNGTEAPDHPGSALQETDGLRPQRCSDSRLASDRLRSFRVRQKTQTVTP
jgi:hypothetical protein